VEEVVAVLAGNLEADEAEACSRDNGLLAFAADGNGPEFHNSPPQLSLHSSFLSTVACPVSVSFMLIDLSFSANSCMDAPIRSRTLR
jgi:hypothetical protein